MGKPIRAAAVQLHAKMGDSASNIDRCDRLAQMALKDGARWIALPEFFNTGVCWDSKIAEAIQRENGEAGSFLKEFSIKHGVVIGGSFLCRLTDGTVRNRYLCYADGMLVGRHDKDLPTMWENAFYEGGNPDDTGFLGTIENIRIGTALCWEYMRTMTARRLRNQVDLIMGGSCWWSIPTHFPKCLQTLWEPGNSLNAIAAVQDTARLTGVPVVHGAHCGEIRCPMPGIPMEYRGFFEGNAAVIDASGRIIAHRRPEQGEGYVIADVETGPHDSELEIPARYWLRKRGPLPFFAWHHQRWLGRRWYFKHVHQRR
jgi:predicted amidohydrolase